MIGGILRPVARLVCLCGPGVMLFDSGGDDNFVTYNSVPGALKIDLFFCLWRAARFCCGKN